MIAEKAGDERHAFYLLRPKFREMWVEDKELHCAGFIDRVHKDFDGLVTLGDYKTSSKYGIGLPESFKRQLAIYGLLYYRNKKELPNFTSIIFLRYGEEYILEVTPSLLKYARDTIDYVWSRTRSVSLSDYPKHEGTLCGWCPFKDICSGEQEFVKGQNKNKLKKILGEKKNDKL
jgi:RecB family exonuclease